jgi:hypothetical protein
MSPTFFSRLSDPPEQVPALAFGLSVVYASAMPGWWYDRRLSRRVAEGAAALGLLTFITSNWTSIWFGITSAFLCFGFGAVAAARARVWILCISILALMLLMAFIALLVDALSNTTWGF